MLFGYIYCIIMDFEDCFSLFKDKKYVLLDILYIKSFRKLS